MPSIPQQFSTGRCLAAACCVGIAPAAEYDVAGAQAHLIDGEGHISMMRQVPAILEDLRRLGALMPES